MIFIASNKGELLNLVMFDKGYTEGVSNFNVRSQHIVDYPDTMLNKFQVLGRGLRFGSHQYLSEELWQVFEYE